MAKTEAIPFREFVRGEWRPKTKVEIVTEHVDRNKVVYRAAGVTLTLLFVGDVASAATSTGIDAQATKLYEKLLNIGKWVIIVKGAFDTVGKAVEGDFVSARKSFLGYLIVYVILSGLPWSFNQVDEIFKQVEG